MKRFGNTLARIFSYHDKGCHHNMQDTFSNRESQDEVDRFQ